MLAVHDHHETILFWLLAVQVAITFGALVFTALQVRQQATLIADQARLIERQAELLAAHVHLEHGGTPVSAGTYH